MYINISIYIYILYKFNSLSALKPRVKLHQIDVSRMSQAQLSVVSLLLDADNERMIVLQTCCIP